MSAIVTNAKNRIAYNIVRSLGQKGIEVHTSDFVPLSMSFASRYSKSHFLYPSPFSDQEAFIACIISHIKRLRADVLIPAFEETFLISKHKDELSRNVRVVIPDYDQILTAHNKDKWSPIANELNIPTPRNYSIMELRNETGSVERLRFPVLIKPKQGGGAWAISQIDSIKGLHAFLDQDTYMDLPWDRFFFQEKINGENHCVAMLFRQGEYRAKTSYRQVRDLPATGGQATMRISVPNERAEGYLERMLKELKWHGICQADFVIDGKTNIPYLIDINPRFWGSLTEGVASGVDLP